MEIVKLLYRSHDVHATAHRNMSAVGYDKHDKDLIRNPTEHDRIPTTTT